MSLLEQAIAAGRLVITAPTGETLRVLGETPAEPGQSVYLTIDRDLQAAVQAAFIEAYNQAGPTWSQTSPGGAAVVMNVKTGEILAIVSYPWFDPSLFNPDSPVLNRGDAIAALRNNPRSTAAFTVQTRRSCAPARGTAASLAMRCPTAQTGTPAGTESSMRRGA